jgi:hypothetical protein
VHKCDTSLVSKRTFYIFLKHTVYTTLYTGRFEDYCFHRSFETSSVYCVVYVLLRRWGTVLLLASDMLWVATVSRNSVVRQQRCQVSQNGGFKTKAWADGVRDVERRLAQPLLTGCVVLAVQQSDRDEAGGVIICG